MTGEALRKFIKDAYSDVTFLYKHSYCCIVPEGKKEYSVGWSDTVKNYDNVDELMNDPMYDGKTLYEICDDITELEMV
jgi:hypothetical protein